MDLQELEVTLEAALAVTRPTARDVRDALVDYYAAVARPFLLRGLIHSNPEPDEQLVRRLLMLRLGVLWNDLGSAWDTPALEDLRIFRRRIDQYACAGTDERYDKARRLIDQLVIAAAIGEHVKLVRARPPIRRFTLIRGGGRVTEPRGQLKLVQPEAEKPPASQ